MVAGTFGALIVAVGFSVETASAQFTPPPPPMPRPAYIGIQPHMRIPVGSRAESTALKADQDAARLTIQKKQKGRKGR
jgi:hypothetical protein